MIEFKCRECGHNRIEEVLPGVTQYSPVIEVEEQDGDIVLQYDGACSYEGGDSEAVYYQCMQCGNEVSTEELAALVDEPECEDCGSTGDLKPWKYEPAVKLCEGCYDNRMMEDE